MTYDKGKIPVQNCVIRLCRICGNSCLLSSYEWDSEYRWYNFYCQVCGFKITLGEYLSSEFHEDDYEREPLTYEERAESGRTDREYEKHQKWKFYRKPNEEDDGEFR